MSEVYPDAELTELGIKIGDAFIPGHHIEGGTVAIQAERGFFHRVSLTVFVESIHIDPGVEFTTKGPQ